MRRLCLAVAIFSFTSEAVAGETARDAYQIGSFLEAATLAEAEGGADDLALAARALLAEVVTGNPSDIDGLLARAESNARRSLARDAGNTEARLQLAVAIGMKGRRATIAEAMRKGYAIEGRNLVRAAMRDAPHEAWAYALEGGWNLEVLRRGGAIGAAYFGASVDRGRGAFARARELAPDDPLIAYQYAIALLELDSSRYGEEAMMLLEMARACRANDAFERRVQVRAGQLVAILRAEGAEAAIRNATARFQ